MEQQTDICGMCLAEVEGSTCEACGVDRSTWMYKIGRFLPPIFLAFLVASLCRVGASFIPDSTYGLVALGFAGAVGSVTAVHAMGNVSTRMKLASALLASLVVVGLYALELLVLSSTAGAISGPDTLLLLQVFGGGMVGGIAIGWPASNRLASAPPFAQLNGLTAKIPQPRLRLFTRVLVHTTVVAAIVALIIALLVVAIALLVAYFVLLMIWGILREFAYQQWGIGKSPEQRRAEAAMKKEEKRLRRAEEEARAQQMEAEREGQNRQMWSKEPGVFRDSSGQIIGRTDKHGVHRDPWGRELGRTDEHGVHRDPNGRELGRTDEHGVFRDPWGRELGRTDVHGVHRDPNGRELGSKEDS